MEQTIFIDNRAISDAKREFLNAQNDVNEFLKEAKKCKLQVNDIAQLHGLIINTQAEANAQYKAKITDADLETTGGMKLKKEDFFKTLDLPDISKLVKLGIHLHIYAKRLDLGTLNKNKMEWSQRNFDQYTDQFVVRSDSELSKKLLAIADSVTELREYLQDVADKKKMDVTILSNLLPSLPALLIESGKKVYVNPTYYEALKESIR